MNNKHILFTGGGTAGHVMVNLALIPVFQNEGWTVHYIGSKNGIERQLIGQLDNVAYYPISTGKLRRYMSIENFKDPFKVLKGMVQAWKIIGKCKPAVVFSKGGFVSVPVVFASRLRKVPIIIHESDYTPGLANKLANPFAQEVLTTFPETERFLRNKKATYVGAVIREELFKGDKTEAYTLTGLNGEKPVLLIMGGSAGSQKINEMIRSNLDQLLSQFQLIHICGQGNKDKTIHRNGYVQFEYVDEELKHLLAITDLVVSRAGANAIFEFLALRKPMLLIPLSLSASRGDQIVNAKSFVKSGYAHMLEEENLTEETLMEGLQELQKDRSTLIQNMKQYESSQAKDNVVNIIKQASKY